MTAGGNYDDDEDDFGGSRRDRDRGQRRGGRREFTGDVPDFGGPPPDAGNHFGDSNRGGGYRGDRDQGGGGYRGGGDRDQGGGGYRGGGDRGGQGGYRGGGDGDQGGGGYRGGQSGGGGRPQYQDQAPNELGPRQNGVLKFFNTERGFGFVSPEDGSKDVFVHISAIERSGLPQLEEGTKVSFETEQDRRGRGPQAVNLQLIDD